MSIDKTIKIFKRATARYGMYFTVWLFKMLPYGAVQYMTGILVAIGFRFTIKQRRLAKESLTIAFGKEKTQEEIDQIIRKCFANIGRGMVEMIYFFSHPEQVMEKVSFEGRRHLDDALAKGHGVIAVTAHFGNFPLMMLACVRAGYKTSAIIRPTRDQDMEKFLFNMRTKMGLNTVYALPRHTCVSSSLKILRNNEILFIPLDQNFGRGGGVFVDFFGHKAATATGPVVLAMRTKAVILPMFIIREDGDRHKIIIESPFELEYIKDEKEMIRINIARITRLIEQYIRRYPHEWGWMHRRWKSQP